MQLMTRKSLSALVGMLFLAALAGGARAEDPELVKSPSADKVDLTIYGGRLTQVQETRTVHLKHGLNRIQLYDIASQYSPDSFRFLGASEVPGDRLGLRVGFKSATYQPANLTTEAVLRASIGKEIVVYRTGAGETRQLKGTLLAVSGGQLVLKSASGETQLVASSEVVVPALPDGLSNTASLVVEVESNRTGKAEITFMYETGGLAWHAIHNLVYNDSDSKVENWQTVVSLTNESGITYSKATVRLMSGRALGTAEGAPSMYSERAAMRSASVDDRASVEDVGDQKTYVLPGAVTLENGKNRQVLLLEARNVPVTREYFVPAYSRGYNRQENVSIRLKVENCQKHNLGQPLPAGIVKVFQTNASGVQQQTGSAHLADKAQDEVFDMVIGTASDIKYTRTLVGQKGQGAAPGAPRPVRAAPVQGNEEPVYEDQTWEVKIFNYKRDRDVKVKVEVALPHDQDVGNPLVKRSAQLADGEVEVTKSSEKALRYTVKIRVR